MAAETYVFRAGLVGFREVSRKLAVRGDETLADLHQLLQCRRAGPPGPSGRSPSPRATAPLSGEPRSAKAATEVA